MFTHSLIRDIIAVFRWTVFSVWKEIKKTYFSLWQRGGYSYAACISAQTPSVCSYCSQIASRITPHKASCCVIIAAWRHVMDPESSSYCTGLPAWASLALPWRITSLPGELLQPTAPALPYTNNNRAFNIKAFGKLQICYRQLKLSLESVRQFRDNFWTQYLCL